MEKYKSSLDKIEEVILKELKTTEENYFNADSCDECPQSTIDAWGEEMEKIRILKKTFDELKTKKEDALEKQAEELQLNKEEERKFDEEDL